MVRNFFLLVLTLLLTSCVPSPIALSDTKALPEGETIVFGRVKVIWKGETKTWGGILSGGGVFSIYVLPERGPEPVEYNLEGDGTFLWHLSPGGYTITQFRWHEKTRRVFAYLVVPEGTAPVYIGTLKIISETDRDLISIEDEFSHALQGFKDKFPEIKGDTTKSLMHLEKAR